MKQMTLAAVMGMMAITGALADDLPTSSASVKVGGNHTEAGARIYVLTTENHADITVDITIDCAALIDGEPVETEQASLNNVAARSKAYGDVSFLNLENKTAAVECRISAVFPGH